MVSEAQAWMMKGGGGGGCLRCFIVAIEKDILIQISDLGEKVGAGAVDII